MRVQLLRSAKLGLRALQQRSDFGADWLAHSSKGSNAIPASAIRENLGLSGLPGWPTISAAADW